MPSTYRADMYDLGYTQAEVDAYEDARDEARYMADDIDSDHEGDEE